MRIRDFEMRVAQARKEVDLRFSGHVRNSWREAANEGITHLALAILDELKEESERRCEFHARESQQAKEVRVDG